MTIAQLVAELRVVAGLPGPALTAKQNDIVNDHALAAAAFIEAFADQPDVLIRVFTGLALDVREAVVTELGGAL